MTNKILIHTCCADCFLNTIRNLKDKKIISYDSEIISLYFNPNIHPRSEYLERLNALKKVILESNEENIHLVIPDYKPKEYMEAFRTKKGNRCSTCWNLRLKFAFEYAQEKGIKDITTTLLTSHYQNRDEIFSIGKELSKTFHINFIETDSSSNCKNCGFYKQNYCGCCFSLTEKMLSSNT